MKRVRHEFNELSLGLANSTAHVQETHAALPTLKEDIANLDSETSGIWLTVDDLLGVPQPILERLKVDGELRWADRRQPNINAVMKSADSTETRRKV